MCAIKLLRIKTSRSQITSNAIGSLTRLSEHYNWSTLHDDIIKWKHFPRYWPFVRGIHWSTVDSPHKGQRSGALMHPLICVWTNGWANRGAGYLRRHRAHNGVTVIVNLQGITMQQKLKCMANRMSMCHVLWVHRAFQIPLQLLDPPYHQMKPK